MKLIGFILETLVISLALAFVFWGLNQLCYGALERLVPMNWGFRSMFWTWLIIIVVLKFLVAVGNALSDTSSHVGPPF
jgi:hypothetical protein